MSGYPANIAAHAPPRSLDDYGRELRGRRIILLHRQLEAEQAGDDDIAFFCARSIASIDARLRAIAEAQA